MVLAVILMLGFSSCGLSPTEGAASDPPTEEQEKGNPQAAKANEAAAEAEDEDYYQEPEKRPAIFYQELLEEFCCKYYKDCFDRKYHPNSLVVNFVDAYEANLDENDRIKGWNMLVKGIHSFKGYKNHNDSPFEASVEEIDKNTFKVTFYIKRYDIFGNQMDKLEEATRTMVYKAD